MKIAVVNFSGNVGKTTIARHLIAPRLGADTRIISVESINSDGAEDSTIRGKEFGDLQEAMMVSNQNIVVDVGASNIESFLKLMEQYEGSHEDFDFFVVPTVAKKKQLRDTISTVEELAEIGIPAKKIRLLLNNVDRDDNLQSSFGSLAKYHADGGKKFVMNWDAVVYQNELFARIEDAQNSGETLTIDQILEDPTDWKALNEAATETEDKLKYSRRVSLKRLATGVFAGLDSAFKALLKK